MWLSLGEKLGERRQRRQACQSERVVDQRAGLHGDRLQNIAAEMILEPSPPGGENDVSGLQHGPLGARTAAAHEAKTAAARCRQYVGNGAGLAMPPDAQDYTFLAP